MGGQVSAQKYKTQIGVAIDDTDQILEFLGVEKIGISREDDEMRKKVKASLTPFEVGQQKVNEKLRAMKAAANLKNENRLTTNADAAKAANTARSNYKVACKGFDKEFEAVEKIFIQQEKERSKFIKGKTPETMSEEEKKEFTKDYMLSGEDIANNKAAIAQFQDQHDKIKQIWDGIGKARDVSQAKQSQAMTVDQLGDLPELDPQSWEKLRQYNEKDAQVDEILGELLKVNQNLKEMAEQFRDEGKKQEALIRENKKNVEQNLTTAKKANSRIDEVKEAIGGKGPGRICIYVVLIILIISVAYGVYTLANGEDPCKEYNDEACTDMSN